MTETVSSEDNNDIFNLIAQGDIIGFKRTSTFARWGVYNHAEASFDVFVNAQDHDHSGDDKIRKSVAGFLNVDPAFIRIVEEEMGDGDYPSHISESRA